MTDRLSEIKARCDKATAQILNEIGACSVDDIKKVLEAHNYTDDFQAMAFRSVTDIPYLLDLVEQMQKKLDMAVEDITKRNTKSILPCHSCAKSCMFPSSEYPELTPTFCKDWKWRGEE